MLGCNLHTVIVYVYCVHTLRRWKCKRECIGENYERGGMIEKLSIEIVLREKLHDDWFIIVIEENENKIKAEEPKG